MTQAKQLAQLKKLSAKRNKLMEKVQSIDAQITGILQDVKVRNTAEKKDHPRAGNRISTR